MTSFDDQLALSEVGDEIVYHKGFHCMETLATYPRKKSIPKAAWDAYERGEVLLYQRRIGPDELEYVAKVVK